MYSNWFRGNWNLLWVAHRYFPTLMAGLNAKKTFNMMLSFTEMATARPKVKSLPFVMRLEPTSICKLRCPRCSCGIGTDPRPKGFLQLNDLDMLLATVKDHVVFVRLDGNGEPLLHPDITEIISRIKNAGMAVTLSTSLNDPPKGGFQNFIQSGIDRLVVALDGTTQKIYEKYRIGGKLDKVLKHLHQIVATKQRLNLKFPVIDLQFLDWGYNRYQIPHAKAIADDLGVERLTVIRPDWAVYNVQANPNHPKRCFWLWCVMTVDWQLNYHTCTNAWTYSFPELNVRDTQPAVAWNTQPYIDARQFNKSKQNKTIASATNCMCRRCTDMLVINRPPGYICE